MQPVDEDIFDLLDRTQKESGHIGRGKFIPSNNAPALISTKGSFAGIGGSGSFRESGWQSYYDYAEEDMMEYEYQVGLRGCCHRISGLYTFNLSRQSILNLLLLSFP